MIILYRIGMITLTAYGLYGFKAAIFSGMVFTTYLLTKDLKLD